MGAWADLEVSPGRVRAAHRTADGIPPMIWSNGWVVKVLRRLPAVSSFRPTSDGSISRSQVSMR